MKNKELVKDAEPVTEEDYRKALELAEGVFHWVSKILKETEK